MGNDSRYALIGALVLVAAGAVRAERLSLYYADAADVSMGIAGSTPVAAPRAGSIFCDGDELFADPELSAHFAECCCSDCCDCGADCRCCYCRPLWKLDAGAVILQRDSPDSLVLLRDDTTGEPIANAGNFEFPWKGGVEVSLARRWGKGELEVRYFGVEDWLSQQAIDVSQYVDGGEDTVFVNSAAADYTSQLHSTEINWRQPLTRDIDWLVGFRWVELHEVLAISAEVVDPEIPVPVVVGLPFSTSNHLYGGQVGAETKLWHIGGPLSVDAAIKAGLFGNHADSDFAIQFFGVSLGSVQAAGSQAAFLGEIDVTGVYQWTEHLALRGGYRLIWVTGVALPPDQLANFMEGRDGMDIAGTVFYHGATVGAELNW